MTGERPASTQWLTYDEESSTIREGKPVLILESDGGRRTIPLESNFYTVGSDPGCDLILSDPYVSSRHFSLENRSGGWFLRDAGSTNGTYVNQVKVAEAMLADGAVISLGKSRLKYVVEWSTAPLTPAARRRFHGMAGQSERIRQVFALIERVAATPVPVLIQGESGTGKELAARAVHALSPRAAGPFIAVNCGAIVQTLVESELFGYERGAFTGALTTKKGAFEHASGGTLFLDEIGEMPLQIQPVLLRVLENGEVHRVGGRDPVKVDVRIIAATHRDLAEEVERGRFRSDLFYRLYGVPVTLPPLRERMEDLPLLADYFLHAAAGDGDRRLKISTRAMDKLKSYGWPGNIRELRNVLHRAAILSADGVISPEHVHFPPRAMSPDSLAGRVRNSTLEEMERVWIEKVLQENNGNKKATATALGIAKSTLFEKLKKYGLGRDDNGS